MKNLIFAFALLLTTPVWADKKPAPPFIFAEQIYIENLSQTQILSSTMETAVPYTATLCFDLGQWEIRTQTNLKAFAEHLKNAYQDPMFVSPEEKGLKAIYQKWTKTAQSLRNFCFDPSLNLVSKKTKPQVLALNIPSLRAAYIDSLHLQLALVGFYLKAPAREKLLKDLSEKKLLTEGEVKKLSAPVTEEIGIR